MFTMPAVALINENITDGCDDSIIRPNNRHSEITAIFAANEYTCANGYFLPANGIACDPCPNGFTCTGGTYTFNEFLSQGISGNPTIQQNVQHLCSANMNQAYSINHVVLVAQFEPNTVNLEFDDGNGNITSTTCEYGDTITIPDTVPTRPGYNFTGWKVRENNH